jgi:antitoxin HicB
MREALEYPIEFEQDGKFIAVQFVDIPEGHTYGLNKSDALEMAKDALETVLELYFETNRPVPLPSKVKPGQHTVALPLDVSDRVLLWNQLVNS